MTGEPWDGRPVVYRVYGLGGHLLYVGCSVRFTRRWYEHTASNFDRAEWAPLAERVSIRIFRDRLAALIAESQAIESEAPLFNRRRGLQHREVSA